MFLPLLRSPKLIESNLAPVKELQAFLLFSLIPTQRNYGYDAYPELTVKYVSILDVSGKCRRVAAVIKYGFFLLTVAVRSCNVVSSFRNMIRIVKLSVICMNTNPGG